MGMNALRVLISAAAFAALMGVVPANAQATRTWVSGVGDDANPCSRTAPCKTFAGAISKTAAGGEINVLDPGGFGGVTITKSITISSTFEAGVLVSGTNGIIINAGVNDTVVLEGLDIEGLGTGLNGVTVLAGKRVYIKNCKIHAFTQSGVNMASSTSGARAFISDSYIFKNNIGVNVAGTSNDVNINNSSVLSNTTFGIQASNTNVASVANSNINDNPTAINPTGTGQIFSFGPSNIVGGAGTFSPGSPLAFK